MIGEDSLHVVVRLPFIAIIIVIVTKTGRVIQKKVLYRIVTDKKHP